MNTPNKLTVLRVVLVPFFVLFLMLPQIPHHFLLAGLVFGVASYTDHLDGMLARKNGQVTSFGKFMDPLADKILVISALVCFVSLGLAPVWMVLLIIAREFMVTSIRLVAASSGVVLAANGWGKAKTVTQMIAIIFILVAQYLAELGRLGIVPMLAEKAMLDAYLLAGDILLLAATLASVLSGIIYLKQNWSVINEMK